MKNKKHTGDLIAKHGEVYDFTEITGNLTARGADKNAFLELKNVGGGAYFQGWAGSAPKLTTVGGYADFQGWTGSAPKLTTVGGNACFRGWTGSAPKLTTVGGYADFRGWAGSAPKLTTVGGGAYFQGWAGSAPKLTTVGGYAYFQGWAGSAPKLTTVGGYADFQGWTGSAPKLTTVGGNACFRGWTGSAPKLTTVGGYADFRGWTGSAPKLTTVGGGAYFQGWAGSAPKLTTVGGGADFQDWAEFHEGIKTNASNEEINASLAKNGLVSVDGILAKLIAKRGPVRRVVIVGKTAMSYIVEREGKTAHGATISEARADLLFKLGPRDTAKYKEWTPETKASIEEMIVAYRTITGACKDGCSHFLAGKNYPPKVTVGFIIGETKGAYGGEAFQKFFNTPFLGL